MSDTVWVDASWTPRPALRGTISADVCVVGLGGAGLAAVSELAARGVDVVGLNADAIGSGAAGRNAGFLLGGLADFFHVAVARLGESHAAAIYQHTLDEIRRLADDGRAEVKLTGSLRIAATADELIDCDLHLRTLRRCGFPAERYSGPEGAGLLIPTDGTYHPLRALHGGAQDAMARGARLFEFSRATAIAPGEVTTESGRVRCQTIVVAIDGGLEHVFPELASRVRTARLQMLSTAPARDVAFPRPVYWRYGYEYWQQLAGGEIALGGFRDRGGEAEWTTDAQPGRAVQDCLDEFLRSQVKTAAPVTHRWAAGVAYAADGLPVIEEVRKRVYAVGSYSGTGNLMSRLSGRAVAELLCERKSAWVDLLEAARQGLSSRQRE